MKPLIFRIVGVVLLLTLGACAPSPVLIRASDPDFAAAQERLARTTQEVDALNPPPAQRAMFMQAEGFYRYRFLPPPKGTLSYAAEAAAAVTDFPGFQSLAGSLDLLDLRYRAPDSAAQVWETLLDRYPDTTLRPFTLYRLGWAYRNVGVRGLPRTSPQQPFDALIQEQPDSKFAGLAREAKAVPWKSKNTAAARSIIPGLGQLYVGETRNGLIRLSIAGLGLAAAAVPVYGATHHHSANLGTVALGFVGLVVLSFDYTSSYDDAMRGVVEWNERAEAEFDREHPDAP